MNFHNIKLILKNAITCLFLGFSLIVKKIIKNRLFNVYQRILDKTIHSKGLTILSTRFTITIVISHMKHKPSQ